MKRVLQQAPPESDVFQAAASGDQAWLLLSLRNVPLKQTDKQGLSLLHVAAMHGHLGCLKLLLELGGTDTDVNASCPRGRRPMHMAVSDQSRPLHSLACLTCLLEHGALPNVSTEEGLTPLHLAATQGLLDCAKVLVKVGADISTRDSRGHTALDLARLWGHRAIARFLKDRMWQEENQRQWERCNELLKLRKTLVRRHQQMQDEAKVARQAISEQSVEEWARLKGVPVPQPAPKSALSRGSAQRCSAERKTPIRERKKHAGPRGRGAGTGAARASWNISPNPSKPPSATISAPQGVRMSTRPEGAPPQPDMRGRVTLSKGAPDRAPRSAQLGGSAYDLPALPWDTIQRGLFPNAYRPRLVSPLSFHPVHVQDLPRLSAPTHGTSPWTEVAMHLAETLEPGRY
ncbi:ankyrin repeat domain-containing protein 53 [Anguilla anguilla]|uniref:ankyrin repeat domain-containing protein 53 n=1 Tax=Anguilla anguilla TaxID=7936 RepID=UPI0015A808B8|nr:ankyrin repeat domain-containing protein 53 [Anguilla anguilla]